MKAVYVTGYGRSGSTLLGRVLSVQQSIVAVGEASSLATSRFVERSVCSCSAPYLDCSFWGAVHDGLLGIGADAPPLSQRRRRLLEGRLGLLVPAVVLKQLMTTAAFSEVYPSVSFAAGARLMATAAGGDLVDISKTTRHTANRPRLLRAAGIEVELHIAARPLRDVVDSYRAAHARRGTPVTPWTAAISVTAGRALATFAARWCAASMHLPIRRTTLATATSLAVHLPGTSPLHHMIGGNRSRHIAMDIGVQHDP